MPTKSSAIKKTVRIEDDRDMKLCVFPNEPVKNIVVKGSLIPNYYNPGNLFDEIDVITFAETDVKPEEAKILAGRANLNIFPVGRYSPAMLPLLPRFAKRVLSLVAKRQPDVIRAYNPMVAGWVALYCGKKLGIPIVVSVHTNYDHDICYQSLIKGEILRYVYYKLLQYLITPTVLKKSDVVVCKYRFVLDWAIKHGAKKTVLAYNRVDIARFAQAGGERIYDGSVILSVGRLIPGKNQQVLIRAMVDIDAKLVLIGSGPTEGKLHKLAEEIGVDKKVVFIRRVPNEEIPKYYHSADIYATAMVYGGVSIPVLEAMAAGLPIVTGKLKNESGRELVSEAGMVVDNSHTAFNKAFKKLLKDEPLREELGAKSQRLVKELKGEEKERDIYLEVLRKRGRSV